MKEQTRLCNTIDASELPLGGDIVISLLQWLLSGVYANLMFRNTDLGDYYGCPNESHMHSENKTIR